MMFLFFIGAMGLIAAMSSTAEKRRETRARINRNFAWIYPVCVMVYAILLLT